jgi:hypothetical protein
MSLTPSKNGEEIQEFLQHHLQPSLKPLQHSCCLGHVGRAEAFKSLYGRRANFRDRAGTSHTGEGRATIYSSCLLNT